LPFFDKESEITEEMFYDFKSRHMEKYKRLLFSEDNDDYVESFILVAPDGRFYSNGSMLETGKYRYSEKIVDIGAIEAFGQIKFNMEQFIHRYKRRQTNKTDVLQLTPG
jgi:radical S-adenosyl methionine domain-containing protein 2